MVGEDCICNHVLYKCCEDYLKSLIKEILEEIFNEKLSDEILTIVDNNLNDRLEEVTIKTFGVEK